MPNQYPITSDMLEHAKINEEDERFKALMTTDDIYRVRVSTISNNKNHPECIGIEYNRNESPHWYIMSLSPARARILAAWFIQAADENEKRNGAQGEVLDKPLKWSKAEIRRRHHEREAEARRGRVG